MRISDWSSDVCSSDLPKATSTPSFSRTRTAASAAVIRVIVVPPRRSGCFQFVFLRSRSACHPSVLVVKNNGIQFHIVEYIGKMIRRSKEHTLDLRSLMRTSYTFFSLNKKTQRTNTVLTTT